MLDARRYHEPEPVVDEPETAPPPSRNRTPTVELTMQVLILGEWHRRMPDLSATACGVPFHGQYHSLRREVLADNLCLLCFTGHERGRAEELRIKARAITIPCPIPEEKP